MNDIPLVSVCVITYNQEDTISQTIDSILAQKVVNMLLSHEQKIKGLLFNSLYLKKTENETSTFIWRL